MRSRAGEPRRPERGRAAAKGGRLSGPAEVDRARHAAAFGTGAAVYERGRPSYPEAALDWLLPARAGRVLDLGAGTGKLTLRLLARGLDVVAVDPSEAMLDALRASSLSVDARQGFGEAIPLDDASVDAVLVAQAWHWMDPAIAVPEVARVLRPKGRLGLVWNHRDESVGWMRELGALLGRLGGMDDGSLAPPVGSPFGLAERRDVPWSHPIDADELVALVASRSYVMVLPEAERSAVLGEVAAIARREPGFAARARVPMPYVARCWRADLA